MYGKNLLSAQRAVYLTPVTSGPAATLASVKYPEVSIVVPVFNEAENAAPLALEIAAVFAGREIELLFVDDGSTDATIQRLRELRASLPQLRVLRHAARSGQSAALSTGVRHARAEWVCSLDGDGQNDPADLRQFLALRADARNADVRLIIGDRRAGRRDSAYRRLQSRIANGVRSRLLGDGAPDTGCGTKLFHRQTYLALPQFDHMHRFLPALFRRTGARVLSVPASHRPRLHGVSKYRMWDRLRVGIVDIIGVMWLQRRWQAGRTVSEE